MNKEDKYPIDMYIYEEASDKTLNNMSKSNFGFVAGRSHKTYHNYLNTYLIAMDNIST